MHQNHGKKNNEQWYEKDPARLVTERNAVESAYPNLEFSYSPNGNATWSGTVKCLRPDGSTLYELEVKIECPQEYPVVFPKVYDSNKLLKPRKCPHLNDDGLSICYGNRLDPELDFESKTTIKDLIDFISVFLARQWYFEKRGFWPDGQLHGQDTFIEHEVQNGKIDGKKLCPCGLTAKKYRDCHLPLVNQRLIVLDSALKKEVRDNFPEVGRNSECPCGSGKKFKKCCLKEINFPKRKTFLIKKFPSIARNCIKLLK